MRYRLSGRDRVGTGLRTETRYRYVADDGASVAFHAHPTEPFAWAIEGDEARGEALVQAFVRAGLNRGATPFEVAIATLTT